jgi:hypothetical protein
MAELMCDLHLPFFVIHVRHVRNGTYYQRGNALLAESACTAMFCTDCSIRVFAVQLEESHHSIT